MKYFNDYYSESEVSQKIDSIVFDNRKSIIEYGETIAVYLRDSLSDFAESEIRYLKSDKVNEYLNFESDEQSEVTDLLYSFISENYNYYPTTIVIIDDNELVEIVKEAARTAHGSELSGWRIPIFISGDIEENQKNKIQFSEGGWLSNGSYQPDAIEVTAVNPWQCAGWEEGGWPSESDYDENDQMECELDEWFNSNIVSWKDEVRISLEEYFQDNEIENYQIIFE